MVRVDVRQRVLAFRGAELFVVIRAGIRQRPMLRENLPATQNRKWKACPVLDRALVVSVEEELASAAVVQAPVTERIRNSQTVMATATPASF